MTEEQIEKTLDYGTAIRLAREAYAKTERGEIIDPPRAWLQVPGGTSLYTMLAHVKGSRSICVKLARVGPSNVEKGLPSTMATIYLFDSQTGLCTAELAAENLTAIRTAASSAVATDLLARKDARVLGVFGAGRQARAHIHAILKVRTIERVMINSKNMEDARRLAREMISKFGLQFEAVESPGEIAVSSDILVLATDSTDPLFDGGLVKDGSHVNAIGAALPAYREADTRLVQRSWLVVDSREQAFSSYGDILLPLREGAIDQRHVRAELGELLVHPERLARRWSDVTLFKSGGIAALDVVAAEYLLDQVGQT